jgi:recombination protein RecA
MRKRVPPQSPPPSHEGGDSPLQFIQSGCTLLDLVLSGGWPLGRISNVVGDKSSGKTLLAIEACANFKRQFPNGKIWYHEAEAAFDKQYAQTLGMPIDDMVFIEQLQTVEELFSSLTEVMGDENLESGLYIIDSLDALSDKDELDRDIEKGSYGASKPKKLSELFRRLAKTIENSKIHLMVISQTRDKIGVMFGEKHSRSGGKALDFYASQIVWLSELGKIKKTINKVERVIGVNIKAKCKKNKIGMPFRECEFPIVFGYGIDDDEANMHWLKSIGLKVEELKQDTKELVKEKWGEIEENFRPKESKYA